MTAYDPFAYLDRVVQMTYESLARSRVLPLVRHCSGCGEEMDVRQEGGLCPSCGSNMSPVEAGAEEEK